MAVCWSSHIDITTLLRAWFWLVRRWMALNPQLIFHVLIFWISQMRKCKRLFDWYRSVEKDQCRNRVCVCLRTLMTAVLWALWFIASPSLSLLSLMNALFFSINTLPSSNQVNFLLSCSYPVVSICVSVCVALLYLVMNLHRSGSANTQLCCFGPSLLITFCVCLMQE